MVTTFSLLWSRVVTFFLTQQHPDSQPASQSFGHLAARVRATWTLHYPLSPPTSSSTITSSSWILYPHIVNNQTRHETLYQQMYKITQADKRTDRRPRMDGPYSMEHFEQQTSFPIDFPNRCKRMFCGDKQGFLPSLRRRHRRRRPLWNTTNSLLNDCANAPLYLLSSWTYNSQLVCRGLSFSRSVNRWCVLSKCDHI